jgi:hypothetical protein
MTKKISIPSEVYVKLISVPNDGQLRLYPLVELGKKLRKHAFLQVLVFSTPAFYPSNIHHSVVPPSPSIPFA